MSIETGRELSSVNTLSFHRKRDLKKVLKLRDQKTPRKMIDILEAAKPENQTFEKKKKVKKSDDVGLLRVVQGMHGDEEGCQRGLKPLPDVIEQGPYESQAQFIRRIGKMSSRAMAEARLENKFQVDFCPRIEQPNPKSLTGNDKLNCRQKKKLKLQNERLEKKRQKRRIRDAKRRDKKGKKRRSDGSDDEFARFQDKVSFGDVVMAPPSFSKQRRKF